MDVICESLTGKNVIGTDHCFSPFLVALSYSKLLQFMFHPHLCYFAANLTNTAYVEKLTVPYLVKKFLIPFGALRSVIVFTRAC
jgi:hypothetical protein